MARYSLGVDIAGTVAVEALSLEEAERRVCNAEVMLGGLPLANRVTVVDETACNKCSDGDEPA